MLGIIACSKNIKIYKGKEFTYNSGATGNMVLLPGLGRSPGGGNGNESTVLAWKIPWKEERGAWWAAVQRVT